MKPYAFDRIDWLFYIVIALIMVLLAPPAIAGHLDWIILFLIIGTFWLVASILAIRANRRVYKCWQKTELMLQDAKAVKQLMTSLRKCNEALRNSILN